MTRKRIEWRTAAFPDANVFLSDSEVGYWAKVPAKWSEKRIILAFEHGYEGALDRDSVRVRRLTPKTKHRDCAKNPCTLCRKREHEATCGECRAGIRLREVKLANGNKATVVEKCDVCLLFETNADAVAAAEVLLDMLDVEYASGSGSVADACERILDLVKSAAELRENFRQEASLREEPS